MNPILQEISQQLISIKAQSGDDRQQACVALQQSFWKQLSVVKKTVQTLVASKDRVQIQKSRFAVTDIRKSAEALSEPALQPVVDKLLQVEKALLYADGMVFGGEINAGLSGAIHYAESAIEASQQAVAAQSATAKATADQDQARRLESRPTPPR